MPRPEWGRTSRRDVRRVDQGRYGDTASVDFILDHRNLNLFHHFGDSAENENNTTRAFLIAASRSPWSPVLLRGFMDAVAARIRTSASCETTRQIERFLCAWPDTVEFSLERNIVPE